MGHAKSPHHSSLRLSCLSLPPAQLWPFPAADAKEWSRADRQTLVRAFTEAPSKPTEVLPNNPCMPIPVPMEATVPKSFSAWCDEMKLNANESKVLTEAFEETGSTILCPETLCLDPGLTDTCVFQA